MNMANMYPRKAVVWRGAILGGLAHAVMAAENSFYADSRYWAGQDYVATNQQGLYGTVSIEGSLMIATFFDRESDRSPYLAGKNHDIDRLFQGCPVCHRCLLETRANLAPDLLGDGTRCATAAFWDDEEDDEECVTAVDPWEVVLNEGARLIRIELIEDIEEALSEWQVDMDMKQEQVVFTRSLFARKIAQPTGMIDLTRAEVTFLRSTSGKPSDKKTDEERMTVCRHRLAALGILMPC
jgi:hypothetical protein